MLVAGFASTIFEVEMGFVCRILKHGRCPLLRVKMGTYIFLRFFHIIVIEGGDARGNAMFYPQRKTYDSSNLLGK
jgi:hypothetical protein